MIRKVYNLCNENNYFTCGSSCQYQKMFDMVENGQSLHDVAVVIWICSDNADLEKIENQLMSLADKENQLPNGLIG